MSSTATAAAGTTVEPVCRIDSTVLNAETISDMKDIALSFFASACGKNRGAFVLDPPDGHTYGCLEFPKNVMDLVGITGVSDSVSISDANSIKNEYVKGKITSSDALKLLNFLVNNVYESTPSTDTNPYGCDVNGLAKLSCDEEGGKKKKSPRSDGKPIRSVNLVGLLTNDEPWADNGTFTIEYGLKDYKEMIKMGLNTVQISVPTSVFNPKDPNGLKLKMKLDSTLKDIASVDGLKVILSMVSTGDEIDYVVSAGSYAELHNDIVLGLTLPQGMNLASKTVVDSIRAVVGPDLPLFLPYTEQDVLATSIPEISRNVDDPNVYGSVTWSHINTVGGIASSNSQEDRSKMFYHESVACTMRSPFEHNACFGNKIPIFWSSGFDLSIDDCAQKMGTDSFKDYGQCDRFDETIDSKWWKRHRLSFASRQMYAAEAGGLGWSYSSWKLGDAKIGSGSGGSTIDHPNKLLSLQDVVSVGLFPELNTTTAATAPMACLNPPENDFILGDDTLAPTASPPPDCGNGWWNSTTSKCDYWIPPPEPTMSPTEPCPVCVDCSTQNFTVFGMNYEHSQLSPSPSPTHKELLTAGLIGAGIAFLLGTVYKYFSGGFKKDYTPIPN